MGYFYYQCALKVWDTETVARIYGTCWRIEIIFKTWKSHFNLTVVTNGSRFYIETLTCAFAGMTKMKYLQKK